MINKNQMMLQLKKMQKEAEEAQRKLESTEFFGTAGGGVVCVKVNGAKEVLNVVIDKEAIQSSEDVEILEDAIKAALNDAFKKVEQETQKLLGPAMGGMGGFF